MNFGQAFEHMKAGRAVARSVWLARGVTLCMVPGLSFKAEQPPLAGMYPAGTDIRCAPYMALSIGGGALSVWTPTQSDLLADDWVSVDVVPKSEEPAPALRTEPKPVRKRKTA